MLGRAAILVLLCPDIRGLLAASPFTYQLPFFGIAVLVSRGICLDFYIYIYIYTVNIICINNTLWLYQVYTCGRLDSQMLKNLF